MDSHSATFSFAAINAVLNYCRLPGALNQVDAATSLYYTSEVLKEMEEDSASVCCAGCYQESELAWLNFDQMLESAHSEARLFNYFLTLLRARFN